MAVGLEMRLDYPEGATPLDPSEIQGLKLPHISTRDQLNKWELENILDAEVKYFSRKHRDILTDGFLLRLHRNMFGKVWKWAGRFRTTERNIGVPHWEIPVKVRGLCEDAKAWIESARDPADEIAALFHHRLVSIHPFANGNGRHARMMADLLLVNVLGQPRFTWGRSELVNPGEARTRYLEALRAADQRQYTQLYRFVRS